MKKRNYKKYYGSKRRRHIRKKKSVFRNRFFWFFVLGVIIFFGLFYFFIFSPVFQIRAMTIQGTHFIDPSEVAKELERITEKNILFFPTKSIFVLNRRQVKELILEKFFPAKEVKVKKQLLNRLLIDVQEREAQVACCAEEQCFLVDNQGFAFQLISRETAPEALPVIRFEHKIAPKDKLLDQEVLEFVSSVFTNLKQRGNIVIEEFKVFPSKIEAKMASGLMIYFSPQKSPVLQVEDLILLVENQISPGGAAVEGEGVLDESEESELFGNLEYIDLRFDKIFYK